MLRHVRLGYVQSTWQNFKAFPVSTHPLLCGHVGTFSAVIPIISSRQSPPTTNMLVVCILLKPIGYLMHLPINEFRCLTMFLVSFSALPIGSVGVHMALYLWYGRTLPYLSMATQLHKISFKTKLQLHTF
jgi:hypothetical protein